MNQTLCTGIRTLQEEAGERLITQLFDRVAVTPKEERGREREREREREGGREAINFPRAIRRADPIEGPMYYA